MTVVFTGLLTIAVLAGLVYLAEEAYNGIPLLSYRTVYASLPTIGHLKQHDPVDIAGVRVGQVLNTSTANNRALVELQLRGVGPLPVDSGVVVRANGLLGERYVELDPGTSYKTLPNGATITEGGGTYTYGIPETLNLFDPATRTALGNMVNGLGEGVMGRGSQLNQAIHVGPPSGANFDTAAYAILGRGSAAANFLPYTNSGLGALNASKNQIADTFGPGATTAQAFVDQRGPIDRLLSFSPSWTQDVANLNTPQRPAFTAVERLGNVADQVLPIVPQALRSATALLQDTPGALRSTKTVLNEVPSAVPSTLHILSSLQPDLSPLRQAFTNLATAAPTGAASDGGFVAPTADGLVPTLAEHGCDIQSAAAGIRSLVNWGTLPGGNFGPDVGFPVGFVVGPQEAGVIANAGLPFPQEAPYEAPCAYSPGLTMTPQNLIGILDGSFK